MVHSALRRRYQVITLAFVFVLGSAASAALSAQSGTPAMASREQLRDRVEELQDRLAAASNEAETAPVRSELARLRSRLEEGDFLPGDVVGLQVWDSQDLSGSYTVDSEQRLQLPGLDPIHLGGVLYAEADSVVTAHLSRFVRDVRVDVRPLKRVAIMGSVKNPGFYDLRPSTSVADALMAAGGPMQNAEIDELELRRDGADVLAGRSAEVQTLTLEQIGIRRGDQLYVPKGGTGFSFGAVVGILGGLGSAAWGLSQIF